MLFFCFDFVLVLHLILFLLAILFFFFLCLELCIFHWLLTQCWVPVLSGRVGLKLNQVLVGYPHSFCSSIVLTYLISETPLEFKGFVTGFVFIFIFGSMQSTFMYQRLENTGLKALGKH